jgi:hypothetical protein
VKERDMGSGQIDVSGVQPEAREIVRAMAEVYVTNLGCALVSLIVHGSAAKGGSIPGSSDVDLDAFVDPAELDALGELPLERALALHADLARIDPHPFGYLQGHVYPTGGEPGVGYVPGAMHLVWGDAAVPIATGEELTQAARKALGGLDPDALRSRISNGLLDHGEGRLGRQVRWLCTDVWPVMYQVACLHHGDALAVWRLTKPDVVARLGSVPVVGTSAMAWIETVTAHYATGEEPATALETIRAGVSFIEAAKGWFDEWAP